MNRTVAADFFQLLSLPGTLLFVVLQSNAAFTNSDTQRRKKVSRKWMRATLLCSISNLWPLALTGRVPYNIFPPAWVWTSLCSLYPAECHISHVAAALTSSWLHQSHSVSATVKCWHRRPASYYAAPVFFKLQEARRFQKSDFVQCVFWVPWR